MSASVKERNRGIEQHFIRKVLGGVQQPFVKFSREVETHGEKVRRNFKLVLLFPLEVVLHQVHKRGVVFQDREAALAHLGDGRDLHVFVARRHESSPPVVRVADALDRRQALPGSLFQLPKFVLRKGGLGAGCGFESEVGACAFESEVVHRSILLLQVSLL